MKQPRSTSARRRKAILAAVHRRMWSGPFRLGRYYFGTIPIFEMEIGRFEGFRFITSPAIET